MSPLNAVGHYQMKAISPVPKHKGNRQHQYNHISTGELCYKHVRRDSTLEEQDLTLQECP